MKDLLTSNVFELKGKVVICATCMPAMDPRAFEKVREISQNIFFVCLESTHMNMIAHKIASVIETQQVEELIFISMDKSPHCIQLQYIRKDIEKLMKSFECKFKSLVAINGEIHEISLNTISLSKDLSKLNKLS